MRKSIARLAAVARAGMARGGLRYLAAAVAGIALPKVLWRWGMPGPVADRIVQLERKAHTRYWHNPGCEMESAERECSISGLRSVEESWQLVAAESAINRMHRSGYTGLRAHDLRFDEDTRTASFGAPGARRLARDTWRFEQARDEDRRRLARELELDVLYRGRILDRIQAARRTTDYWYSPIDFGRGVTTGGSWAIASGTGRWDYLNGPVVAPLVRARRVLDLGANNGVGGLMMLKAGATHVTAIEYEPGYALVARLAQRIFSWADIRDYRLNVQQGDMRAILDSPLPEFDVVTAFCSLYYLEEEDMARIVSRAAGLVDTMVVQSNDQKHRGKGTERERLASTEFSARLLRENGFTKVEIHRPRGYARALLVARH